MSGGKQMEMRLRKDLVVASLMSSLMYWNTTDKPKPCME